MNRSMTFVEQGSVRFERFDMGGKAVLWVIRPGESSADQDWDAREHIGVVNTPGAFGAVDAGFGVPGLLPPSDLENYDEEHPCLDRAALTQLLTQYIRWDKLPDHADLPVVYYHRKPQAREGGPTGGGDMRRLRSAGHRRQRAARNERLPRPRVRFCGVRQRPAHRIAGANAPRRPPSRCRPRRPCAMIAGGRRHQSLYNETFAPVIPA